MIKRWARLILKDEFNIYNIFSDLEKRIRECENHMKYIQRIENKCDTIARQNDILQSKFVSLLNKVNKNE